MEEGKNIAAVAKNYKYGTPMPFVECDDELIAVMFSSVTAKNGKTIEAGFKSKGKPI